MNADLPTWNPAMICFKRGKQRKYNMKTRPVTELAAGGSGTVADDEAVFLFDQEKKRTKGKPDKFG